ncbi:MAG: 3-hydroxyacyl-CoA dehydrogenase/enoyl-CoA hydratase family protein [Pseudomonadota bacterium]
MIRRIREVAVIGSGVMGSGIAALFAGAGIKTLLLDIVPFDLSEEEKKDTNARNRIVKAGFENLLKAGSAVLMHPEDADRIRIGNLEDDFDKVAECDWIIEVVVENLNIKQALLKRIELVRKKEAIITTNTSGIPLKAMSEGLSLEFRRHFMGAHFFNPVRHMHLLELISGEETLPEVKTFIVDFGERILGKGIVWAKDTPNFVGNRIGVYGMMLAMHALVEHKMSIPEADALLGPVLGRPKTAVFKTADLVGLDTLGHVAKNTYDLVAEDRDRDIFKLPDFVARMIEKKRFGNKTRGGFYKKEKKPDQQSIALVIDPETGEYGEFGVPEFPCLIAARSERTLGQKMRAVIGGEDRGAHYAWRALSGWLIYAANRIPEIADTIVEIDNAMKWGYNYQMGPFESWDAIGVAESVGRMEAEGMSVPEAVKKMLKKGCDSFYKTENGKQLYFDFISGSYKDVAVSELGLSLKRLADAGGVVNACPSGRLVDLGEGVFCCEFQTKMNTLNSELIDFIHEALDFVDDNGAGMVIGGESGAFSAGANLLEVVTAAKEGRFDDIRRLIRRLQSAVQRMRYEAFPVVAAPYGLALGGGCEVCLGADRIVTHAELYMGLVESGVGLLPSGGGCLNLWKKFVGSLPAAVTDIDLTRLFIPVLTTIAMAKVSASAADARANGFLGKTDRIVFNRDHLIGHASNEVLKMVRDGYAPPLKKKIRVLGEVAQQLAEEQTASLLESGRISEYDALLTKRIAYVLSGGDVPSGSEVDEDVILNLELEAFLDLLKEKKTLDRIGHMLKTGKPLRN